MPHDVHASSFFCDTLRLRCVGPHPPSATCVSGNVSSCIDYVLVSDVLVNAAHDVRTEICAPRAPHAALLFSVVARPRVLSQGMLMVPSPFLSSEPALVSFMAEFSEDGWERAITAADEVRAVPEPLASARGLASEHLEVLADVAASWRHDA